MAGVGEAGQVNKAGFEQCISKLVPYVEGESDDPGMRIFAKFIHLDLDREDLTNKFMYNLIKDPKADHTEILQKLTDVMLKIIKLQRGVNSCEKNNTTQ